MKIEKNKQYGIIGTIVVHAVVVAILLLFGFAPPMIEYPEPDGIVVDFGELVVGDSEGAAETTVSEPQTSSSPQVDEPEVVTQSETPSIPIKKPETVVNEKTEEISPEEQERIRQEEEFKQKMDALAGKMNQGGGSSEGTGGNSSTGEESGKAGNPNGSGNSGNVKGNPGNPLRNGDAAHLVKPMNTQNCDNPIVLTVTVNSQGNVVDIKKIETALSEQSCIEAAKLAAKKTTFPPDTKAVRYAKITYEYRMSK